MAEPTQSERDTSAANARLNTENRAQSTNEATQRDTQSAQDRTDGGTGADKLSGRIAERTAEPSNQVVFTELETHTSLTPPQLPSFSAIICVNGSPFNAKVYGAITGEVS